VLRANTRNDHHDGNGYTRRDDVFRSADQFKKNGSGENEYGQAPGSKWKN
jgi:hypothetical protein